MRQCRLAERQGLLTGRHLNEVQVFALEILMFSEWLDKQDADPLVRRVRTEVAQGLHEDDTGSAIDAAGDALEDLSAVKWQSPSDLGSEEEVMNEIEMFQKAMAANTQIVVGEDGGGEWL